MCDRITYVEEILRREAAKMSDEARECHDRFDEKIGPVYMKHTAPMLIALADMLATHRLAVNTDQLLAEATAIIERDAAMVGGVA